MSGSNTPKPLTREEVGPGHNAPPPQTIAEKLAEANADLVKRAKDVEDGLDRFLAKHPKIETDEADSIAASFIGRNGVVTGLLKVADARYTEQVEPYRIGQRETKGWFDNLVTELETPDKKDPRVTKVSRIKALSTAYKIAKEERDREVARQAAAEAAKRAAEAEASAMKTLDAEQLERAAEIAKDAEKAAATAASPAAAFSRVTGISGGTTSLRTTGVFDESRSDLMTLARAVVEGKAPLRYLDFHRVNIGKDIRSEHIREIPGCKIDEIRSV